MLNDYTSLTFPTNFGIVVADQLIEKNLFNKTHIPMKFWITYPDIYDPVPPEFTLLVNPNTFTMNFSRKVNPTFTRQGIIVEHWGEMLDTINVEGKIGAYYIYADNQSSQVANFDRSGSVRLIGGTPTSVNITRTDRAYSPSFRNIYSLYLIYKNNGCVYTESRADTNTATQTISLVQTRLDRQQNYRKLESKNRIDKIGSVFFQYDSNVYEGCFDEFSMEEDSKSPFTLKYSFQFTVRQRLIVDAAANNGLTTYTPTANNTVTTTAPQESTEPENNLENLPDISVTEHTLTKQEISDRLSNQIQSGINTSTRYVPLNTSQTVTLNNLVQDKVDATVSKDFSTSNVADNSIHGFFQDQKSIIATKAEAASDATSVIQHITKQTHTFIKV